MRLSRFMKIGLFGLGLQLQGLKIALPCIKTKSRIRIGQSNGKEGDHVPSHSPHDAGEWTVHEGTHVSTVVLRRWNPRKSMDEVREMIQT